MNTLLIVSFTLLVSMIATASDTVSTYDNQSAAKAPSDYTIGIALNSTDFTYQEPGVMKATGRISGFDLMGKYKVNSDLSINGSFNYLAGVLNYDGGLQDGTPMTEEDTYTVKDLSVATEFLTDLTTDVQTSFLVGLGRRVMTDANDPSPYDYRREHNYNYYSVAVQVQIPHDTIATTTVVGGIETMFSGNVKTYLSDVDPRFPDMDMNFNGGSALTIGVNHAHKFDFGTVYAGLNYKKWSLAESESQKVTVGTKHYEFIEPKNTSTVVSLDAGMLF